MIRFIMTIALFATAPVVLAAEPPKVERTIGKEPAYKTEAPKYGLLVFGPAAKDRVWLVQDGDTLHVDRNGNGDLTEAGETVAATKPREGVVPDEGEFIFEVGELKVGKQTHKAFTVLVRPLAGFANSEFGQRSDVKAMIAKDPKTAVLTLRGEIDVPGMKGGGTDGRLSFVAGPLDLSGVLQFANKPADAPVIHFGGPLEVTFYSDLPTMRVGRNSEFVLVVGTRGIGPGTFAMLSYMDTIPTDAKPVAEVTYQPAKPGDPPLKEKYEIKERC